MNRKCLIFLTFIFLLCITAVSAESNDTVLSVENDDVSLEAVDETPVTATNQDEKLEKSYFYDAYYDDNYEDDTMVTHNVVKYYGDTDTKFKVTVYDDYYYPAEGVYVSFMDGEGNTKEKVTNANGNVYFPINFKVGTHYVDTQIDADDGESFWYAENTVKIKSTIPTKELVKYSTSKKKFKIKFLDTKGKALKNHIVKIKKNGKWYKYRTDSKGYIKIKSKFKRGKTKITAYNPVSKEKRKIPVYVLKKGTHKISIRIDDPTDYFPVKKLKNGDYIDTVYSTEYKQYYPGVYVELSGGGLTPEKHTKLVKAKFYFKNKKTGKIITKTSKKVKYSSIKVKPVKGYSPYKAIVWYKEKIKI